MRVRHVLAPLAAALFLLSACGGGGESDQGDQGNGGSGATAVAHFDGKTYDFSRGTCSPVLDENQFVYTTGDGQTFFNISVLGLNGKTADQGGTYRAATLYRKDGKDLFNPTDATLTVSKDLKSGTFRGEDFFSHKEVTGSYAC